jgi:predicted ester cyclase
MPRRTLLGISVNRGYRPQERSESARKAAKAWWENKRREDESSEGHTTVCPLRPRRIPDTFSAVVDYGGGPPGRGRLVSAQENKAVVRRYIEEVWNRHNIDVTNELISPDYLNHAASAEYQRAGVKYSLNWLFSIFLDHRFDIEDAAGDGETVAVRGTCSGTHEGELWGIRPTGKRFAVQQSHWFRVVDGKVAEHWALRDDLGMMRQIGAMPA